MLQVLYTFITLLPSVYPHVNICSYLTCWPNSFFMASLSSAVLIWPSPFVSNCQRRRIIPLKNGTLFLQIKFMIQIKIKCIIFSGTSKPISRIKQFQIISAILRYSLWISIIINLHMRRITALTFEAWLQTMTLVRLTGTWLRGLGPVRPSPPWRRLWAPSLRSCRPSQPAAWGPSAPQSPQSPRDRPLHGRETQLRKP